MLLENKGFFLTEMLLSLSVWLIAAGFFLPLVYQVKNQSYRLYLENTATHILYDELGKMSTEGMAGSNRTVSRNGISYDIKWERANMEVCVVFKDAIQGIYEKCKIFE